MKRILATGITAFAIIFYAASAFSQETEKTKPPKETRHLKLVKIVDGKKMALDTVITGTDPVVWQGDTIYSPKDDEKFGAKGEEKVYRYDVQVDEKDGKKHVMVFRDRSPKGARPFIWHSESGDDDILNLTDGDSVAQKIIIHKRIKDGDGDHVFSFDGPDMLHFAPAPPAPPVPPVPHIKMLRHFPDSRVIDLNDPDIISYRKKELSGGREKIEIIRKKADKKDMTFDFNYDSLAAPDMQGDLEHVKEMKIMEKKAKLDGKDGRQIDVKVETDNNK